MTVTPQYDDDFGDITLDIDPYTGWNWTSAQNRDQWSSLLARMKRLRSEAEWRSVMDDDTDRDIAIIHLNHSSMEDWAERLGRHGLHYRTLRHTKPYDGFAHSHRHTSPRNPKRVCYAAIAENEDLLDAAEEAENDNSLDGHDQLGELLGFPSCCRQHFQDIWLERDVNDPIYEAACNTPSVERVSSDASHDHLRLNDPSPWVNVMWRYFGLSFITHLPCSFECEASEHVAYHRGRIMEDVDEEAAHALKTWLDQPHSWSGHNGIAHVKSELAIAQTTTSDYLQEKKITWREQHPAGGEVPGGSNQGSGVTAPNI
jgi:hypothetical protein